MKNYSIKLMNLQDLIKFNHFLHENHIRGTVVQNKYKTNAYNIPSLMMALPLENAELIVEKCDEKLATVLQQPV